MRVIYSLHLTRKHSIYASRMIISERREMHPAKPVVSAQRLRGSNSKPHRRPCHAYYHWYLHCLTGLEFSTRTTTCHVVLMHLDKFEQLPIARWSATTPGCVCLAQKVHSSAMAPVHVYGSLALTNGVVVPMSGNEVTIVRCPGFHCWRGASKLRSHGGATHHLDTRLVRDGLHVPSHGILRRTGRGSQREGKPFVCQSAPMSPAKMMVMVEGRKCGEEHTAGRTTMVIASPKVRGEIYCPTLTSDDSRYTAKRKTDRRI